MKDHISFSTGSANLIIQCVVAGIGIVVSLNIKCYNFSGAKEPPCSSCDTKREVPLLKRMMHDEDDGL